MRKRQSFTRPGRSKTSSRTHGRGETLAPGAQTGPLLLYGIHAVEAALNNPRRRIEALFVTANAADRLADSIRARAIVTQTQTSQEIARRLPEGAVHQGALALAGPLPDTGLDALLGARTLLVLDQVTDPHNIGAIIRTAAAFGVGGVILQARGAPDAAGALAKSASGGLEHVPYLRVTNLARALEELKAAGFWVTGLDSEADMVLGPAGKTDKTVLVLGAEGRGLRRLTREHCDALARIALPGPIVSLNVSNAAAIALYALMERI